MEFSEDYPLDKLIFIWYNRKSYVVAKKEFLVWKGC